MEYRISRKNLRCDPKLYSPIEDLVLLQKLWLNRNHILVIDSLKKLKKLK